MDANDRDPLVGKVLVPARVPRVVADAVESAEGPKMQHDHLATQIPELKRFAVDPFVYVFEFRSCDVWGTPSQAATAPR